MHLLAIQPIWLHDFATLMQFIALHAPLADHLWNWFDFY